jgi:hypothetical protein
MEFDKYDSKVVRYLILALSMYTGTWAHSQWTPSLPTKNNEQMFSLKIRRGRFVLETGDHSRGPICASTQAERYVKDQSQIKRCGKNRNLLIRPYILGFPRLFCSLHMYFWLSFRNVPRSLYVRT